MPSEIPRLTTDLPGRVFAGVWKLLSFFKTPFPGCISILTSFVSLFIFYILSYLLSKTMGCLSGCLMSSVSIQKLFCGIYSAFKCSFVEFVGEKVVSPSYSSAILGPHPCLFFFNMMSRFVIAFLPRRKHLLISWLQSPSVVILEPKKMKSRKAREIKTNKIQRNHKGRKKS